MIRPTQDREFYINLDGPQGNANVLMATAINLANQVGLDGDKIIMEMRSGDYINLVKIFDKYFGKYVILETTNEDLLNASEH